MYAKNGLFMSHILRQHSQQLPAGDFCDVHGPHDIVQLRRVDANFHVIGCVTCAVATLLLLEKNVEGPPDAGGEICLVHLRGRFRRALGAFALYLRRDLVHFRSRCARARGVGENVHIGKAARADEVERRGEFLLCLLRKADDQVGRDGRCIRSVTLSIKRAVSYFRFMRRSVVSHPL